MAEAKRGSKADRPRSIVDELRMPPHSVEAEQAVLGGLMLSSDAFDVVVEIVAEPDFYRRDHRIIYRAIRELADKNRPFDPVTLDDWCKSNGLAEQTGGLDYFFDLVKATPSAANIAAYAQVVRDKSMLRQLIDVGTTIANDGYQPEGRDPREILDGAEARVLAIAEQGARGRLDYIEIRNALSQAFRTVQERYEAGGNITGVATGYTDLDAKTAGLQPSDLIIVAGRPSMGKTSLALCIAEHAALQSKLPVGVFSMEMSAEDLTLRLISSVGRIHAERLRTGQLEEDEWSKLTGAMSQLHDVKILIDDEGALSPERLRAKARRMKREHGLGLVVIDYLQLMQVPGNNENRATEIATISRSLKALAKELNVPVVALSQLNRGLEQRQEKRPTMGDLRESGAIEADADVIMFVYRDEYYNKDSQDKGVAEIIIGKQRKGPTGMVKLRFFGEYTRFDNFTYDSAF